MEERPESRKIGKEPCPSCGSSDNLIRYDDGHAYCFSPGCGHYEPGDGQSLQNPKPRARMDLIQGEVQAIPNRGLTRETCERYGYQVATLPTGKSAHLAPYRDPSGRVIAQKIRTAGKEMWVAGDTQHGRLFGQNLLRADGGKMVVVTEGELDALSASQALGNRWPVVSIPSGAGNAARDLAPHIAELEKYDAVVLAFDMDDPGRKAIDECVVLFTPGKVRIAHLPDGVKDANDLVKANRSKELSDAIWGASAWTPDVLNDLDDALLDEAAEEQPWGLPWPWVTLTKATYGIQRSALYTWGAGTGSGKTTLMKQLVMTAIRPDLGEDHSSFLPMPEPRKVATILYEEPVKRTLKTLAGMVMGQRIHVPGTAYDKGQAREVMAALRPYLKSISLKGARNWETVKATIRYLTVSEGVRDYVIDPMTALTAGDENERTALDGIMSELAGLAEDLDITIHLVFHLATPDGTSHEDGGRVQEKHFRGSRAVAFWSHFLMGVERNKQDPDSPTTIRGLKDRLTGDAIGPLIALTYDRDTGLMVEVPLEADGDKPFKDETHQDI